MANKKTPLVSVIIAFLNEERFLEDAIKSVLEQEFKDWELILVDDGSTDSSTSIALKYAENFDGKVVYCEHEGHINKGLSASRNRGIKQATGPLIAFLDGDDVWLPNKLTNQVSIFEQNPQIDMIAETTDYWYDWDNSVTKNVIIPVGVKADKVYDPPQLMVDLYPLGNGAAPCTCALLVKKEAITDVGGFEDAFKTMYEDQAFLVKMYLQKKVYISSACNNRYRQRHDSMLHSVQMAGYHSIRKYFLLWLENYFNEKQISNKLLKKMLRKALLPYKYPVFNFLRYTAPRKGLSLFKRVFTM